MLSKCKIESIPKIVDTRGNLSFIENNIHINFETKRIYYLYDVPGGSTRGGHAHKELHQLILAISGSFDVHLDDGYDKKTYRLNCAHQGLYLCPMIWRTIDNFSSGSVCLVLASDLYDENDYISNLDEFIILIIK